MFLGATVVAVLAVVEKDELAAYNGDTPPVVVLDLAANAPVVVRALKAEKKLAKNGLCVDIFSGLLDRYPVCQVLHQFQSTIPERLRDQVFLKEDLCGCGHRILVPSLSVRAVWGMLPRFALLLSSHHIFVDFTQFLVTSDDRALRLRTYQNASLCKVRSAIRD